MSIVHSKDTLVNSEIHQMVTICNYPLVHVISLNPEINTFLFLTVYSDWLSGDINLAKYFDK